MGILFFYLMGSIIGLLLAVMWVAIDQRRGVFTEVAAVHLLVFVPAIAIAGAGEFHSLTSFALRLAPFVQFLFLALPLLVAVRLLERMRLAQPLQISDLLRVTTVVSLAMFVFTSQLESVHWLNVTLLVVIFIAAEKSLQSPDWLRNLCGLIAIAFSLSFFTGVFDGHSILDVGKQLAGMRPRPGLGWGNREVQGPLELVAFIVGVASLPLLLRRWWRHSVWIHRLASAVSVWRFSIGAPADLIFTRPMLDLWHFRSGVCFLNHGSFGAVPLALRDVQQDWQSRCQDEPMDFFARQVAPLWLDARFQLATWLGTQAENLAFCENATAGMNELAGWFPLSEGDEVLLTDHEYGAVHRIWQRRCAAVGARLVIAELPMPFESQQQIVDAITGRLSPRTKLAVVSHITSPTAVRLPVEDICRQLRASHVASCVDGPHALLQERVQLMRLGCDFYTASCHKWLCAPVGSGFVYADPKWHPSINPLRLSWGRLPPQRPEHWTDELLWSGTRDFSAYLTVPHAIRFFQRFDIQKLDQRNHALARFARQQLSQLRGAEPVTPEGREWFGWLVAVWLPPVDPQILSGLQQRLWENYRIEVPIVHFRNRYLVRVSCHCYNSTHDIDYLVHALNRELSR